jgi:hypothetical protein
VDSLVALRSALLGVAWRLVALALVVSVAADPPGHHGNIVSSGWLCP